MPNEPLFHLDRVAQAVGAEVGARALPVTAKAALPPAVHFSRMATPLSLETLLVLHVGEHRLAVSALSVRDLLPIKAWRGATPMPLDEMFGDQAIEPTRASRVLDVETRDGDTVPLLVSGDVVLKSVPRECLRDLRRVRLIGMPSAVARAAEGVVRDELGWVVLLSPEALRELGRERHVAQSERPSHATIRPCRRSFTDLRRYGT